MQIKIESGNRASRIEQLGGGAIREDDDEIEALNTLGVLVPLLGLRSRVSEILSYKRRLI